MKARTAAIAVVAAILLTGSTSAASAESTHAPTKPGPRGVNATGFIRSSVHPGWCITAPHTVEEGTPLVAAQCVPKDAFQTFFCTRFRGFGECALLAKEEPLDIGQKGTLNLVRAVDPDKNPGETLFVLNYIELKDGHWAVRLPGYHGYQLSFPNHVIARHTASLHWLKSNTKNYTTALIFPEWKEDEGSK